MRKSHLSWHKQSKLIELFIAGSTARTASHLVNVNKSTASYCFLRLRELIYTHFEALETFDSEVKVDESYFGGRRKGNRGGSALGKVPVFSLLKRNSKVYTVTIPNSKSDTLLHIIRQKVKPDSIVYTDTFRSYNALDVSEFKHFKINHSKVFARKYKHINGIENFWNQAKRHMRKFNGVPKEHFHLFLKECEWRFNNSDPKV